MNRKVKKIGKGILIGILLTTPTFLIVSGKLISAASKRSKDKVLMVLLTTTLCKLNQKRMIEQENFITKNYNVSLFHTLKRTKASCLIITQKISNRSKKG